jgi:hypothetical protein
MATTRKKKNGEATLTERPKAKPRAKPAAVAKPKRARRAARVLAIESEDLFSTTPPVAIPPEPIDLGALDAGAPVVFATTPARRDPTLEVGLEDEVAAESTQLVHLPAWRAAVSPWSRAIKWARPAAALTLVAGLGFTLGFVRARRTTPSQVVISAPVTASTSPQPALIPPPPSPDAQPYEAERALGHAEFSAGHRQAALRHYDAALRMDRHALDAQMTANLVACYGRRQAQPVAAALIVRHQLRDAEPALQQLRRTGATRHAQRRAVHAGKIGDQRAPTRLSHTSADSCSIGRAASRWPGTKKTSRPDHRSDQGAGRNASIRP